MGIQRSCRRIRELKSGRYFCQVQGEIIAKCMDDCPYNKPVKYGEKIIKTRFGKVIKIKIKIEDD